MDCLIEFVGLHEVMLLDKRNRGMKEAAIIGKLRSALADSAPPQKQAEPERAAPLEESEYDRAFNGNWKTGTAYQCKVLSEDGTMTIAEARDGNVAAKIVSEHNMARNAVAQSRKLPDKWNEYSRYEQDAWLAGYAAQSSQEQPQEASV